MHTLRTSVAITGLVGVCVSLSVGALTPLVSGASTWGSPQVIDTNLVVGPPQSIGPSSWVGPQPISVTGDGTAPQPGAAPAFGGGRRTAPRITEEPSNEAVTSGSTASFSAAASGSPTPTVQWEESATGSSWSAISGATSDTYSFTATTAENGEHFEAVFSNEYGSATTTSATLTVSSSTSPTGPSTVESSNWSGYADTGSTFRSVSGDWTVPTVSCSGATAYSAQWVGIDGYSSDTVEQDGTSANCAGGSASYSAWYEMYGDTKVDGGDEVELSPSSYPVAAGNALTASVSVSSSSWTLDLSDTTKGWNFSTTVSFTGAAESSAEWVVERPEVCEGSSCSLTTLANFGTVSFMSAAASTATLTGNIASYTATDIEMVNGSTVIAQPGALTNSGAGFTDTYE